MLIFVIYSLLKACFQSQGQLTILQSKTVTAFQYATSDVKLFFNTYLVTKNSGETSIFSLTAVGGVPLVGARFIWQ